MEINTYIRYFKDILLIQCIFNLLVIYLHEYYDIFIEAITEVEYYELLWYFISVGYAHIVLCLEFNFISKMLLCLFYSIELYYILYNIGVVNKIKPTIKHWLIIRPVIMIIILFYLC